MSSPPLPRPSTAYTENQKNTKIQFPVAIQPRRFDKILAGDEQCSWNSRRKYVHGGDGSAGVTHGETLHCAGASPTRQLEKECSLVSDSNAEDSPNVDIDKLLTLAREKSQEGRNSLFDTVQELFVKNDGSLTDRERAVMSEILR